MYYDLIVLGSGPGGYIAAIRAAQLGSKVAIIEKDKLGGVCLNRGCIPTKALLKSAHSVAELKVMKKLGVNVELVSLDPSVAVDRASGISERISKGVEFLMKKHSIDVVRGNGIIKSTSEIEVEGRTYSFSKMIIATGSHPRTFPGLEHDGVRILNAWDALKLRELPKTIGIIGAGAIGVEFAYFWNKFGVEVHIFELADHLLPLEDNDCSVEVERAYKRNGVKLHLGVKDLRLDRKGDSVEFTLKENDEEKSYTFEMSLLSVGMIGNIEGYGLEDIGVELERGFIKTDDLGKTNVENIYAIGDITGKMQLAHVASHQGVIAAEHIMGKEPHLLDLNNVPACTYCYPQVASIGKRERDLIADGTNYKSSKLPFRSNGKAVASEESDGFVKVLFSEEGELLGAHIVGTHATELIHEYSLFKSMEGVPEDLINTVHPHPTLGEWLHEAVLSAEGIGLNS